jgi:hypothetical protein
MAAHAHTLHAHGEIAAPSADVWAVITDVERFSEILRSVQDSQLLTEGAYDVGTRWRESRHFFDHKGVEEVEVIEINPGIHTMHRTVIDKDVIVTAYNLTSIHNVTRLSITATAHMEARGPAAYAVWRMFGGLDKSQTHKMMEHDIEDFAAEVARRTTSASDSSAS